MNSTLFRNLFFLYFFLELFWPQIGLILTNGNENSYMNQNSFIIICKRIHSETQAFPTIFSFLNDIKAHFLAFNNLFLELPPTVFLFFFWIFFNERDFWRVSIYLEFSSHVRSISLIKYLANLVKINLINFFEAFWLFSSISHYCIFLCIQIALKNCQSSLNIHQKFQ